MSKGSKPLKYSMDRISAGLSSGIILDQEECRSGGLISQLKNQFKTRLALNQAESVFLDFKVKQFPMTAKDRYYDLIKAYKRKDKVDLMKFLSVPLYDIFKNSIKENKSLPFKLYDEIVDVKLVQARIYSLHKHGLNSQQTWHQLTCKFVYIDKEAKKDVIKYNVFERREADSQIKDWRVCHLE